MSDAYTEIYYHFVWSTKNREHFIHDRLAPLLCRYLRDKAVNMGVVVYALNTMPEHVHIACALPTTISIAKFVHDIKGSSAHYVNHQMSGDLLYWQPSYGILTFAKRDLPVITAYIENQQIHHADNTVFAKLERMSAPSPPQSRRDFLQQ